MQVPVDITFRGMAASPWVTSAVERWADRLGQHYERIQRCEVVIEQPHRSSRSGGTFHVRIELQIPNQTITVSRDSGRDPAHEDVYVAIADAFRAARRQILEHLEVQRGDVKVHA